MNRELYFATPIYVKDVGSQEFNSKLEQNIINWSNQDKGLSRTNMNGWHSTDDMHTKPEYKELVDLLFQAQREIYKEEHLDSEPFLGNMWANVNPPGGMNRAHMHPNSLWSGVYYVKAPKNSGHLKIDDPRSVAALSRPKMKEGKTPSRLWRETHYEPKAGRLIMFPSLPCISFLGLPKVEIRISVSFNFLQKGLIV